MAAAELVTDFGYQADHEIRCPWCSGQLRCLKEGLGCGRCKVVLTDETQRKVSRVRFSMREKEDVAQAKDLIEEVMGKEVDGDDETG